MAKRIAVIDTETNRINEVMSIGIIISEDKQFEPIKGGYWIIKEAAAIGGMFSYVLKIKGLNAIETSHDEVIKDIIDYLRDENVEDIFAYNASFDLNQLPELSYFRWHDIISLAAYKQYNPCIPNSAECYGTGRMKKHYGVECMMSMFGETDYIEIHNAFTDAIDELRIMKYLKYGVDSYPLLKKK